MLKNEGLNFYYKNNQDEIEDISSVYESNKLKLTELLDSDYELKYKVKDLISYWNSYLS